MSVKKRGLGRGLDALLATSHSVKSENSPQADENNQQVNLAAEKNELHKLPIEFLKPGKYQPRKDMSPEALEELASSIRAQGIIQPIVVRQLESSNEYEIIAGERRWRAAQLAKLDTVPCLVKKIPDEAAVAIALIENIQREDLNAMEEAIALDRLLTEFELTHQQVADAVGKSRTTVTNLLRLNSLEDEVKTLLEHGDIEMGHARCLLALTGDTQIETGRLVAAKGLTVRDTEKLVNKLLQPPAEKTPQKPDPNIEHLQNEISEMIGSGVKISHNRAGKGKMVIDFANLDALDGIIARLKQK
ncbi:ParB/RepB/Spo0J family partition protein [Catenovulum sp. 2E275]|uniref:ParB/RepB/Spo0J family partition protein n=1 Tax=Catenovulum sp. 2E275 TaxID=2980497 RepID=UPI0021CFFEF7|nr:ParB/RepB/Spo0J family partition protein [Catenovulum sp. 2E275]MCU4676232.1 ParB/RepB/Spo0J family partition protein [Catenovulum sp. 2E275]